MTTLATTLFFLCAVSWTLASFTPYLTSRKVRRVSEGYWRASKELTREQVEHHKLKREHAKLKREHAKLVELTQGYRGLPAPLDGKEEDEKKAPSTPELQALMMLAAFTTLFGGAGKRHRR